MSEDLARRRGDPNFPEGGLNITPSYEQYRRDHGDREGASPPPGSEDQGWARDSRDDIERFGIAGRVWEAAYVLQKYVTVNGDIEFEPPFPLLVQSSQESQSVLELGAGAGVTGIHLARVLKQADSSCKQATVILTDLANVLPLLQRNLMRCSSDVQQSVKIRALPWGSGQHADVILQEQEDARSPVKHILCSDLVYFPELLPPLLRSMIYLTSSTSASITISYKVRSLAKEEPFWRAFGVWFDFHPVLCRAVKQAQGSEWRRLGTLKVDLFSRHRDVDEEAEDTIFVFHAVRKLSTLDKLIPNEDSDLMAGYSLDQEGRRHQGLGSEQFELIMMNCLQG
jgi:hypothetical protein